MDLMLSWTVGGVLAALVIGLAAVAPAGAGDIRELEERFLEPEGFQWGRFTNADGAMLRYGWIEPEREARAIAVVTPGRAVATEKYFETVRDLLARDFAVWTLDWRGQGGSDRYLDNPHKGHTLGFEHDVADLRQFLGSVVTRHGKPLFLFGESMGAHFILRYLHDHPGGVDFAVLLAPMLEINTAPAPGWLANAALGLASGLGADERYLPGAGDWDPTKPSIDCTKGSSDPVRCIVRRTYNLARPRLRMGGPTIAWAREAYRSMALVNEPDYLSAIHTPLLVTVSLADPVLVPAAIERACPLMPDCRLLKVAGAKHALLMERDEYRDQYIEALDRFTDEMLAGRDR